MFTWRMAVEMVVVVVYAEYMDTWGSVTSHPSFPQIESLEK